MGSFVSGNWYQHSDYSFDAGVYLPEQQIVLQMLQIRYVYVMGLTGPSASSAYLLLISTNVDTGCSRQTVNRMCSQIRQNLYFVIEFTDVYL